MRRRKLRVGIIGAGAFARACHLPGLASHPRAEVVMLCGRDAVRTEALALEFGIRSVTLDPAELCASKEIDAVTICTPNNMHGRHALLAFAHGKHVFCEKPLALTVDEATAMVAAAKKCNVVHQVGFTFRHLLGVQELRRRVKKGDIGEPLVLRVQHQYFDGVAGGDDIRWQHRVEDAGGGVLRDSGSHLFDLARLILGPVAAVKAELDFGGRPGVETDDVARVRLRHESGVRGECFASRLAAAERPNYVEVVGTKGALHAFISRGGFDALRHFDESEWHDVRLPDDVSGEKFHALYRMMHSFVDGCLKGQLDKAAASFDDGLAVQQIIAAAEEAARTQEWVKLATPS
jgi:predicted dehydrogenase